MDIADVQRLTDSVEGFLSQNGKNMREGEVLYHLARKNPGIIVEIGSWKGKSTIWIAKGSPHSTIYAIDPHTGSPEHTQGGEQVWTYDEFMHNINKAGVANRVIPLVKSSRAAVDCVKESISFLFIDGAHEYEAVREDFTLWFPKVKIGGVIAFHDSFTGWKGVIKLVHKEIYRSAHFANVRYIDSITYATKVHKASLLQRVRNHLTLLVKCIHEKTVHFPQPLKSIIKHSSWLIPKKVWLKELESDS